eukprot:gnl/Dysnectes_brevis/895_a990_2179.p1 GENE.gnl/Dysnectes_brevis/895_a990_2179~~gnl/Dysnectes_brevis/895_a990_2179.p1  ORF type:complete len:2372 (-),score=832.77 gnl/Dysnectes_brevis/895_a990_2179:33-7148(-)
MLTYCLGFLLLTSLCFVHAVPPTEDVIAVSEILQPSTLYRTKTWAFDSYYDQATGIETIVVGSYGSYYSNGSVTVYQSKPGTIDPTTDHFYKNEVVHTFYYPEEDTGEDSSFFFGYSVAVNANFIVISAPEATDGLGMVYVYSRADYSLVRKFQKPDYDDLGKRLAITDTDSVITMTSVNSAYSPRTFFSTYNGSHWTDLVELAQPAFSVSISGMHLVTSYIRKILHYDMNAASWWDNPVTITQNEGRNAAVDMNSGAHGRVVVGDVSFEELFTFTYDGSGTWTQEQELTVPGGRDGLGTTVAIKGDVIITGNCNSETGSSSDPLYMDRFELDGTWTHITAFQPIWGDQGGYNFVGFLNDYSMILSSPRMQIVHGDPTSGRGIATYANRESSDIIGGIYITQYIGVSVSASSPTPLRFGWPYDIEITVTGTDYDLSGGMNVSFSQGSTNANPAVVPIFWDKAAGVYRATIPAANTSISTNPGTYDVMIGTKVMKTVSGLARVTVSNMVYAPKSTLTFEDIAIADTWFNTTVYNETVSIYARPASIYGVAFACDFNLTVTDSDDQVIDSVTLSTATNTHDLVLPLSRSDDDLLITGSWYDDSLGVGQEEATEWYMPFHAGPKHALAPVSILQPTSGDYDNIGEKSLDISPNGLWMVTIPANSMSFIVYHRADLTSQWSEYSIVDCPHDNYDYFIKAVLTDEVIAVSAYKNYEAPNTEKDGKVHVYRIVDTVWTKEAELAVRHVITNDGDLPKSVGLNLVIFDNTIMAAGLNGVFMATYNTTTGSWSDRLNAFSGPFGTFTEAALAYGDGKLAVSYTNKIYYEGVDDTAAVVVYDTTAPDWFHRPPEAIIYPPEPIEYNEFLFGAELAINGNHLAVSEEDWELVDRKERGRVFVWSIPANPAIDSYVLEATLVLDDSTLTPWFQRLYFGRSMSMSTLPDGRSQLAVLFHNINENYDIFNFLSVFVQTKANSANAVAWYERTEKFDGAFSTEGFSKVVAYKDSVFVVDSTLQPFGNNKLVGRGQIKNAEELGGIYQLTIVNPVKSTLAYEPGCSMIGTTFCDAILTMANQDDTPVTGVELGLTISSGFTDYSAFETDTPGTYSVPIPVPWYTSITNFTLTAVLGNLQVAESEVYTPILGEEVMDMVASTSTMGFQSRIPVDTNFKVAFDLRNYYLQVNQYRTIEVRVFPAAGGADVFSEILPISSFNSNNISVSAEGLYTIRVTQQDQSATPAVYIEGPLVVSNLKAGVIESQLTPSPADDVFAQSVDQENDGLWRAIGGTGEVVIYQRATTASPWTLHSTLTNVSTDMEYGTVVSIRGEVLAVLSFDSSGTGSAYSSMAYIYDYNTAADEWQFTALVLPHMDYGRSTSFFSVNLVDDSTVVFGGMSGSAGEILSMGVKDSNGDWPERAIVLPITTWGPVNFDNRVIDSDGDTLVIGIPLLNKVLVFNTSDSDWIANGPYAALSAPFIMGMTQFGKSVSIYGKYIAVGGDNRYLYRGRVTDTSQCNGAVYIYELNDTTGEWEYSTVLTFADWILDNYFGISGLSINGNNLLVTHHYPYYGVSLFSFDDTADAWVLQAYPMQVPLNDDSSRRWPTYLGKYLDASSMEYSYDDKTTGQIITMGFYPTRGSPDSVIAFSAGSVSEPSLFYSCNTNELMFTFTDGTDTLTDVGACTAGWDGDTTALAYASGVYSLSLDNPATSGTYTYKLTCGGQTFVQSDFMISAGFDAATSVPLPSNLLVGTDLAIALTPQDGCGAAVTVPVDVKMWLYDLSDSSTVIDGTSLTTDSSTGLLSSTVPFASEGTYRLKMVFTGETTPFIDTTISSCGVIGKQMLTEYCLSTVQSSLTIPAEAKKDEAFQANATVLYVSGSVCSAISVAVDIDGSVSPLTHASGVFTSSTVTATSGGSLTAKLAVGDTSATLATAPIKVGGGVPLPLLIGGGATALVGIGVGIVGPSKVAGAIKSTLSGKSVTDLEAAQNCRVDSSSPAQPEQPKKKKKKKKKKKSKALYKNGQTNPPTIPVANLYPEGCPEGATQKYSDQYYSARKDDDLELLDQQWDDIVGKLRESAEVHREVRAYARRKLKPGVALLQAVEDIEKRALALVKADGKHRGMAFPCGLSLNHVAAHWSPMKKDDRILQQGDICKVDFGIHIDGHLVDSAFTLHFDPKHDILSNASKDATMSAIKHAGIDCPISELGDIIEEVITSYEVEVDGKMVVVQPVRNLSGHLTAQYEIHAGKSIPNCAGSHGEGRMEEGEVYALETFASTGKGRVHDDTPTSHFMLNPDAITLKASRIRSQSSRKLFNIIRKTCHTLAFCPRWFERSGFANWQVPLSNLVSQGIVNPYPPLVDTKKSNVSQWEHTFILKPSGKEVLTAGPDY